MWLCCQNIFIQISCDKYRQFVHTFYKSVKNKDYYRICNGSSIVFIQLFESIFINTKLKIAPFGTLHEKIETKWIWITKRLETHASQKQKHGLKFKVRFTALFS